MKRALYCVFFFASVCHATWLRIESPLAAVRNPAVALDADGHAFVLGGRTAKERTAQFARVCTTSYTWQTLPDAPYASSGACLWSVNNTHLMLFGGRDDNGNIANHSLWFYKVQSKTWYEQTTPAVIAVYGAPHWSMDGQHCFYGGKDKNGSIQHELWCFANNTWQQQTTTGPSPLGIEDAAYAMMDHTRSVYFFGGEQSSGNKTNTLYRLDMRTFMWQQYESEKPAWREDGFMMPGLGERSLILFGGKSNHITFDDAYFFRLRDQEWHHVHWHIDVTPRWGAGSAKCGQTTVLFGGRNEYDFFSDLWIHRAKDAPQKVEPTYEEALLGITAATFALTLICLTFVIVLTLKKKRHMEESHSIELELSNE